MTHLGPYRLHTVDTGTFGLDGGAMFGIVPKPLWEQRIAPDDQNRISLHMRCLLLNGADRTILIDTGIGDTFDGTKYADIYAVNRSETRLATSLNDIGIAPDEITDVILTHLHFDHCGGSTRRVGDDDHEVAFENATFYVQRDHWEWATDPNPKEAGSFLARNIQPLAESGQLQLVDGRTEIVDAVEVLPVHGHTRAQQMVKIAGEASTLVYVGDLLPTTHHLPAAWTMAYDVEPLRTIEEKAEFLHEAARSGWDLFFEHDPDVAVASLEETEHGIEPIRPRPLSAL